jgi:hypothetical protein
MSRKRNKGAGLTSADEYEDQIEQKSRVRQEQPELQKQKHPVYYVAHTVTPIQKITICLCMLSVLVALLGIQFICLFDYQCFSDDASVNPLVSAMSVPCLLALLTAAVCVAFGVNIRNKPVISVFVAFAGALAIFLLVSTILLFTDASDSNVQCVLELIYIFFNYFLRKHYAVMKCLGKPSPKFSQQTKLLFGGTKKNLCWLERCRIISLWSS